MTTPLLSEIWRIPGDGDPDPQPLTYDTAVPGRELGPVAYVLDGGSASAYARLFGGETTYFPTIPARHTGILRDRHWLVDGGGINARTEVELFRPPRVGETIVITGGVVGRYVRRGKPYVVQMAEARTTDGLLIDRVKLTEMRERSEVATKWGFLTQHR